MYAFIHIPKTAGSTVRHLLRCSFGSRHCDIKAFKTRRAAQPWVMPADLRLLRLVYPRLAGICGHRVVPFTGLEQSCPQLRFFTFLREPQARFMSNFWHDRRHAGGTATPADLERFCLDGARRNVQTRMLCGTGDAGAALRMLRERVGFVGLTEDFDVSLMMFTRWLDRPAFQPFFHTRNRALFPPPWSLDDHPGLRPLVQEANAEDAVLYRTVVEVLYPAQIRRYAGDIEADIAQVLEYCRFHREHGEALWAIAKRNLFYKPLLHFCR